MTKIATLGGGDQSRPGPWGILDIRGGDPYDQNFDPSWWGPITFGTTFLAILDIWGVVTNHGGDPLGAILDIRGDPYDRYCDPWWVGTNHGGDTLGPFWTQVGPS